MSIAKALMFALRLIGAASVTRQVCSMQMVLKCADIGHLAAGLKIHKRWAYQLEEEFFRQVSHHLGVVVMIGPYDPYELNA